MSVKFLSLHYKFLALSLFMISVATGLYLYLATELFKSDKTAYIYDNNAAFVETLAEEVSAGLVGSINTARHAVLVWGRSARESDALDTVKAVLGDDDSFVDFAVLKVENPDVDPKEVLRITHDEYLKPYDLDASAIEAVRSKQKLPIAQILRSDVTFRNVVVGENLVLLEMLMPLSMNAAGQPDHVVSAMLRQDKRLAIFQRSKLYTTYLTDRRGEILAHSDPSVVTKTRQVPSQKVIDDVIQSGVVNGAREYVDANAKKHILAYKKVGIADLYAFSEIPYEKAFLATKELIDKSVWFAALVFSFSFAFSLLFTRKLTDALRKLYNASLLVARGDFSVRVAARTRDEVGALATSFNHMTGEISRLLVETEVKARMEHELKTAQLVQENFFPKSSFTFDDLSLVSYFKPATECGGDWWTVIPIGDKFALLIGDATGHGVPAALITAAAHSCASTLTKLSTRYASLLENPEQIATYLNAAICAAGRGKIKMTFFIAVIDPKTGRVDFVNAAHETPVICRGAANFSDDNLATKEALDSVDAKPDGCLGESPEATFHTQSMTIEAGDSLILYTDGLIENANSGGEEYGERRFLRSFLKSAHKNAATICEDLVSDYSTFAGDQPNKDDVTLIVLSRTVGTSQMKAAS